MSDRRPDYYAILGVARDADPEEIKKRFRKLARECHPDVAGTDPAAAERFTQIREAYETLIDPAKRAVYDAPPPPPQEGTYYRRSWRPPGGHHFEGLHNGSTGSGRSGATSAGGKNRWKDPANTLDLEDIFNDFGTSEFGFGAQGGASQGRPTASGNSPREEAARGYTGRSGGARGGPGRPEPARTGEEITLQVEVPARIARQGGTVTVQYPRLRRAERGDALHNYDELYELRVPPGTRTGATLRAPRMGHAGTGGGPYGDLVCAVRVVEEAAGAGKAPEARPPEADATDIVVPISLVEALLGGRIEVDTPTGRVRVSIPPCTSSDARLRLRGKGAAGADIYVRLRIVVPATLDAESRELIEQFAALNPSSPER